MSDESKLTQQEIAPKDHLTTDTEVLSSSFSQPVENVKTQTELAMQQETAAENDGLESNDKEQSESPKFGSKQFRIKKRITTYDLTLIAVFMAIGIVLNMYSAAFPKTALFGRFSLIYGYCLLCGVILGAIRGSICAALSDILVALIMAENGQHWMPLITLSNFLMAFIPGLLFKLTKQRIILTLVLSSVISFVVCTLGFTALGESLLYLYLGSKMHYPSVTVLMETTGCSAYIAFVIRKAMQQPVWIVLNLILSIFILKATEKHDVFKLKRRK